eukprot:2210054-Rhodomonas_salina.1
MENGKQKTLSKSNGSQQLQKSNGGGGRGKGGVGGGDSERGGGGEVEAWSRREEELVGQVTQPEPPRGEIKWNNPQSQYVLYQEHAFLHLTWQPHKRRALSLCSRYPQVREPIIPVYVACFGIMVSIRGL